jgi:hypothetical protein
MAALALLLFIIQLHLHGTTADYGGWESAHATFYGGGDASGTMGKSLFMHIVYNQTLLFQSFCFESCV